LDLELLIAGATKLVQLVYCPRCQPKSTEIKTLDREWTKGHAAGYCALTVDKADVIIFIGTLGKYDNFALAVIFTGHSNCATNGTRTARGALRFTVKGEEGEGKDKNRDKSTQGPCIQNP